MLGIVQLLSHIKRLIYFNELSCLDLMYDIIFNLSEQQSFLNQNYIRQKQLIRQVTLFDK